MTRKEKELLLAHIQQEINHVKETIKSSVPGQFDEATTFYLGIEQGLEFAKSAMIIAFKDSSEED